MFGSKQRQNCFCGEAGGFHHLGYLPHSTSITAVITAFNFSTAERRSSSSSCNAPGTWPAALRSDRPEADLQFTPGNNIHACILDFITLRPSPDDHITVLLIGSAAWVQGGWSYTWLRLIANQFPAFIWSLQRFSYFSSDLNTDHTQIKHR